jgi:N-dimethylarginine dimethylaminohydrolase
MRCAALDCRSDMIFGGVMDHDGGVREAAVQLRNQVEAGQHQDIGFAKAFAAGVRFGQLNFPVLLMNLPLSLSAQIPNNASMQDRTASEREICLNRAIAQFARLYGHVAQHAVVYLLPSTPGLQDQPYVSNLGAVLPHCKEDTVIISRFRSAPRVGEDRIGADFFKLMNFTVEQPPATFESEPLYFEGEADLKHIHGNFYVGGHGLRTSRNALTWAAERFEMEIVPFRTTHPYLYHLDCCILRITEQAVLMCTSVADRICTRAIEQHCEIVDVSLDVARAGVTNCLLLPGEILCDSNIMQLGKESPKYPIEKSKIERLETICWRFGLTLRVFCMSEFYKSGAMLSCLIMHIRQVTDGVRYYANCRDAAQAEEGDNKSDVGAWDGP